jgi:hypothetical protein
MFVQFANEWRSHCSQKCTVVWLENHLGTDRQLMICGLDDEVVTTGTTYPDSPSGFKTLGINVLPGLMA